MSPAEGRNEGALEDKAILITGGASGIGMATAEAAIAEGAAVMIADRDREAGEAVAERLRESGGEASFSPGDVTERAQVAVAVGATVNSFGGLDGAVNAAGIAGPVASITEQTQDGWDRVIATNLTSTFVCLGLELEVMAEQGSGSIVNMSSILGLSGVADLGPYVAAKHGVMGLTKVASIEVAEAGVRVNAVCPGYIDTPMLSGRFEAGPDDETWRATTRLAPMLRLGRPEEIADTIVWLLSDRSSYVTGQSVVVDGGRLARR